MAHLISLPPELHFQISSYLTPKAVANLAQTCRSLLTVCNVILAARIPQFYKSRQKRILFRAVDLNQLEFAKRILEACPSLDADITRISKPSSMYKLRLESPETLLDAVDWQDCIECNTLGCAARHGNLEMARILLARGANPNPPMRPAKSWVRSSKNYEGAKRVRSIPQRTPLWISIQKGDLEFCKFLLHRGADPNVLCYSSISDTFGLPPLWIALEVCRENPVKSEIVQTLLDADADALLLSRKRYFLLERSIHSGSLAAFEMIYARIISQQVLKTHERGWLLSAAVRECPEAMETLTSAETINHRSGPTKTAALHEACKIASISAVRFLVERGADINVRDEKGNTPLHLVARLEADDGVDGSKSLEVLKYLVENGADIHVRNRADFTALDIVLRLRFGGNEKEAKARVLVDAGAEATWVMEVRFQTRGLKEDEAAFAKLLEDPRDEKGVEGMMGLTEEMQLEDMGRHSNKVSLKVYGANDGVAEQNGS